MRRFKFDLLAPFVRDAVAFAILGISVATILGMAAMSGQVHQASLYQSMTPGVVSL